jgi:anaerobic dimethyl sulfoxide reductase subunit A
VPAAESRVLTGCAHDCGGKCLLVAHVRDGRVVRVTGEPEAVRRHRLEPCVRGLRYEARVHHPDRLLRPLVRWGPRGSGLFREASWDEALAQVADRLAELRERHDSGAFLCLGRSGSLGALLHDTRLVSKRFFSVWGGHLGLTGNYSNGAAVAASQYTYGTTATASSRSDWLRSRLLLLWGWDPLVTVLGSQTAATLRECRRRGIPLVVVDPRRSRTAALADRWIPIRPGSDVALLNALAHELVVNGWCDRAFLDRFTVGFEPYRDHLLGAEDGIAKTPEWQEPITGVPAETARWLARQYATCRPAALLPGWGPQRSRQGEQFHRATAALACFAGYVGIPGGAAAGLGAGPGPSGEAALPVPANPYTESIPVYRWADCVLRGPAGGYPAQPRAAYIVGGNPVGQHPDSRRTQQALAALDLVVVHELFLTPPARWADVVLPATTFMERDDILQPYSGQGCFYIAQRQAIPPQGSCRDDLDVFTELADRLGCAAAYTEGRDAAAWLRHLASLAGIADYDGFRAAGIHWTAPPGPDGAPDGTEPHVAFRDQIASGVPFATPSGRIEIWSERLAARGDPLVPPIPRYLDLDEGPGDPLRVRLPLQLLSPKSSRRTNSTFDNVLGGEQAVRLHPEDAAARGLRDGERVRVWNDRGSCVVVLRVSDGVTRGVAVLPSGAWVRWGAGGDDEGGCPNTLTSDAGTAWSCSSIQQTALVEVSRVPAL